jgi:aminoglycoside phosphotransferase
MSHKESTHLSDEYSQTHDISNVLNFPVIQSTNMSLSQVLCCGAEDDGIFKLKDSRFFTERQGSTLPRPLEIRAVNKGNPDPRAGNFKRPPPVSIPSLGLFVKYGGDVTVTEAQTQLSLRSRLSGSVPIPEVYGWAVDNGQTFIYMELVEGVALYEVWGRLGEPDRLGICEELRAMIQAWRALKQLEDPPYIGKLDILTLYGFNLTRSVGSYGRQPINDIHLNHRPELVGPFQGQDAVQQLHERYQLDIRNDEAIVFTHNDITPPNIMVTRDPTPRVAAIIDWAQSGWYPAYWEYCKAKQVGFDPEKMSEELQDEWQEKYVPKIIDEVDNESCYYRWLYFMLDKV